MQKKPSIAVVLGLGKQKKTSDDEDYSDREEILGEVFDAITENDREGFIEAMTACLDML